MSLHPQALSPIPEEPARVARAAYPKGNVYMQIRDELGTIYQDEAFTHLFPNCGQPAEAPGVCCSSVWCNLQKDFPISKQQRLFEGAWI